jgi:hypothetical protein
MSFVGGIFLTERQEIGYKRPRPAVIRDSLISSASRNEMNAMGVCSCMG